MAQRITLVDDIDGSEGAETVAFTLLGGQFQLDLTPQHSEQLDSLLKAFHPFGEALQKLAADNGTMLGITRDLDAGAPEVSSRPVEGVPVASAPKPASTRPGLPAPSEKIRAWARANGWEVSAKGKIPKAVVEAFIAADNGHKGNQPGEIPDDEARAAAFAPPGVRVPGENNPEAPQELPGGPELQQPAGESPVITESGLDIPVPPADDAPVEDWRAYARALGLAGHSDPELNVDLDELNRSQIRTALGLDQPIPTGPEWGDPPPAASQTVDSFPSVVPASAPNPEAGPTDEPTLGQRLHREADARKEAARVAAEAAASVARAQADAQRDQAGTVEPPVAPLTPEQVEEQARAEIAQAQGLPAPEPTTILPFRQPQ